VGALVFYRNFLVSFFIIFMFVILAVMYECHRLMFLVIARYQKCTVESRYLEL